MSSCKRNRFFPVLWAGLFGLFAAHTVSAQSPFEEYKRKELHTLIDSYRSISADYLRGR
jgi:hypothetical protein